MTATNKGATEDENAFTSDMALAQAEMENAVYNRINPHFKSKYADYAAVREAVKPAYSHGFRTNFQLRVEYTPTSDPITIVRLVVQHRSGKMEISEKLLRGTTEQQEGSSLTYSKRQLLSAYFGIASEDDDDGNAATQAETRKRLSELDKSDAMLIAEMRQQITHEGLKQWGWKHRERLADIPGARDEYKTLMDKIVADEEALK